MSKVFQISAVACLLCWLQLFAALPVNAQEVVFSDDFSQGLDKWQVHRGSTSYWSVEHGALKAEIPYRFIITELIPKDEYWNPAWQDLEYSFTMTPHMGIDRNASFNIRNIGNWFEVHFVDQFLNIVRMVEQNIGLSTFHDFQMENGQRYEVTIRFNKGSTTVIINGQIIAENTDDSFIDEYGKIGLKASTGTVAPSVVYFDDVKVKSLNSSPQSSFITFKQHDPQWAANEYDHAQTWDRDPTIKRWGCAVTSLAMIFRHHQLNYLPNGEVITPSSLNEWLRVQPDGYLFEGYVNWLAATRLSRLISDRHGTPKLEYRSFRSSELTTARTELNKHRPVILEIDGHFLVGNRLINNDQDIGIADPAYDFASFSEHRQPLRSTRTFTPSHTDLSYILIAVSSEMKVEATLEGQPVSLNPETLSLRAWQSQVRTPPRSFYTLPKPASGTYTLYFSTAHPTQAEVHVLTYTQDGTVSMHHPGLRIGPTPSRLYLQFDKDAASVLEPDTSATSSLSQLFFWLRWYLPTSYYSQLTDLEHQLVEAAHTSPSAWNTVAISHKAVIATLLAAQPIALQNYILQHFP